MPPLNVGNLRRMLGSTDTGAALKKDIKRALEGRSPDARQPAQAQPAPTSAAEQLRHELAARSGAGQVWSNTDGLANQAANAIAASPQ